jgi:hypothetical protein
MGDIGEIAHFRWRNTAVVVSRNGAQIDEAFLSGMKICVPK